VQEKLIGAMGSGGHRLQDDSGRKVGAGTGKVGASAGAGMGARFHSEGMKRRGIHAQGAFELARARRAGRVAGRRPFW